MMAPLRSPRIARCLGVLFASLLAQLGSGQQTGPQSEVSARVDFARQIAPILENRCQGCHGPAQQLSGLRLDDGVAALKGGYSGPVIAPGSSSASRLVRLISGSEGDLVMPPVGDRLSADEVRLIGAWIDEGAHWPATEGNAESARADTPGAGHWAFRPISQPDPPAVRRKSWVRSPIDRFVLARLEREGVEPAPPASRATLVRRVSLDLTGLPPSDRDVEAYLSDPSPAAYERIVDKLLESPHYGERWATQWLDLARYADSDGYEKDSERPYAWRWRQWVIDALNDNMPFDRFTIEQIAGDVLPDPSVDQQVATGFHRNGLKNREGGVKLEQFRYEETVDRTNTVGTVWLGLTVGCAQCHDHKYDPVSQAEYYRFFAFFNSIEEAEIAAPMPGEIGPYLNALPAYLESRRELLEANRVYELLPAWEAKMVEAADNPGKWTDWDHALDAVQKYLDNGEGIVRKERAERSDREQLKLEDHFIKNYHRVISKELWKELDWVALRERLLRMRSETPDLTYARTIADSSPARRTHIHLRGGWNARGVPVEPGTPSILPSLAQQGKHPRLALAEWLVSLDNPLTARVIANRIWQEYFGRGIVPTADDFGTRSPGPTHPALLDWLASEFVGSGWNLKELHKAIVMSATYRQSSDSRPDLEDRDPDNELLARQRRLRLPAELVRDVALAASGLLNTRIGGPSVRPPQPPGVADLAYAGSVKWQASDGADGYRRGLYTFLQRTAPYPQLVNFDMPDRTAARCARERSNTPLQALNLLNDSTFVEAARALAIQSLATGRHRFDETIRAAFRSCLSRAPTAAESRHLKEYYSEQKAIFDSEPELAAEFMPLAVSGLDAAEAAAWTGVASVLLNLDEFITRE
ncbi:MAG: DUF1553 domain-containing protein [Acidobacteriia bacterium]|nr:DUF1553 domain-containing protein [Terriglobia bacterium]